MPLKLYAARAGDRFVIHGADARDGVEIDPENVDAVADEIERVLRLYGCACVFDQHGYDPIYLGC